MELNTKAAAARTASQREDNTPAFWAKHRPRYLFSGLMRCGVCGGGFSKVNAERFSCSTARNKGPVACTNRLSIRRDTLEGTVLDGLASRLMDPELFKAFVNEFTAEWNRMQSGAAAEHAARQAELERIARDTGRLVDAITNGTPPSVVNPRLHELENRRVILEAELSASRAPSPRLHPNLAELYRQKVAALAETLAQDDDAETREMIRGLVEAIVLVPEDGRLRVEIRGELAAILSLAEGSRISKGATGGDALSEQIKLVAGIGFEPMTFRL